MNVAYVSECGMYRVLESKGLFYPQERRTIALGYGRIATQQEVNEVKALDRMTILESPFEGWYLGKTCRGVSKGFKCYNTLNAALKFLEKVKD